MFCKKCGTQFAEGSMQCPNCGWSPFAVEVNNTTPVAQPNTNVVQPTIEQPAAAPLGGNVNIPTTSANVVSKLDKIIYAVVNVLICISFLLPWYFRAGRWGSVVNALDTGWYAADYNDVGTVFVCAIGVLYLLAALILWFRERTPINRFVYMIKQKVNPTFVAAGLSGIACLMIMALSIQSFETQDGPSFGFFVVFILKWVSLAIPVLLIKGKPASELVQKYIKK